MRDILLLLPTLACLLGALFLRTRPAGAATKAKPSTAEALQRQSDLLQATNDAALLLFSDDEDLDSLATRALGGVGAVTTAILARHVIEAAERAAAERSVRA